MTILENKKFLWAVIIVLLLLNIFLVSTMWLSKNHRPYTRGGRPDPQLRNEHFLKDTLKFSRDQQAKFDSLTALHRAGLNAKTEEMRDLRNQLVTRMKNQEFDSLSEQLIGQIGEKQAELEMLNFTNFRDIMSICDETQKQAFLAIIHRAFRPRDDFHRPSGGERREASDRNEEDGPPDRMRGEH